MLTEASITFFRPNKHWQFKDNLSAGNMSCKYADVTYLYRPITLLPEMRKFKTPRSSRMKTVSRSTVPSQPTDPKRKSRHIPLPPTLPKDHRRHIQFISHLSVSQHVHSVTNSCAQHLYTLRVIRVHGMGFDALQQVFRAVLSPKLLRVSGWQTTPGGFSPSYCVQLSVSSWSSRLDYHCFK